MNNTKDAMYCRLCALLKRQNQLIELQTDDESCQRVVNQLSKLNIVLDLQENILPKTVCSPCVKSLEKAFKFVTAVEEAQAFLCDFIPVKIDTAVTHSCEENIYEGEGDDKNGTNHFNNTPFFGQSCKNENCQDSMEVNDCGISSSEDIVIEVMTDMYNVNDVSVINSNTEEFIKMEDIQDDKQDIYPTKDVIKQNMDIKVECDENPDVNHVDDKKKLLNYVFAKVNNNSESTLLENLDCSTDEVNKHNDSKVTIATNSMDKSIQQLQLKQESKSNKNQTQKFQENDQKDSNMAAKNTYTDIEQIKMTWKEYEWQCSHCETLFPNVDDLQEHSMQFHNFCNLYQCIDCGTKRSNLKSFIIHVRTHRTDLNHSCHVCFEKFLSISKVASHRRWEHENSKYVCLGCRIPFDNNSELKEHVDKYYKKTKTHIPSDLTCRMCSKICANGEQWRRHRLTHRSKEFVCETCGRNFLTKQLLKTHVLLMHDTVKKLFKCDICNTAFKSAYKLRKHTNIHSGIKPWTCDDCGKSFRTKQHIAQHMTIHTKSLPFTCTVCSKKFRTKSNLRIHMRQHTGAQPFSCDICLRDFTDLSNRNKHMRRRHGIEMVKKRQLTADVTSSKTNNKNKKVKANRN